MKEGIPEHTSMVPAPWCIVVSHARSPKQGTVRDRRGAPAVSKIEQLFDGSRIGDPDPELLCLDVERGQHTSRELIVVARGAVATAKNQQNKSQTYDAIPKQ